MPKALQSCCLRVFTPRRLLLQRRMQLAGDIHSSHHYHTRYVCICAEVSTSKLLGEVLRQWPFRTKGATMHNISSLYNQHFLVRRVDTCELRRQVFALRYSVYCLENNWLDRKNYNNELEEDELDARSLSAALIHRRSGEVVGCVRLIRPDPASGIASLPMAGVAAADGRPLLRQLPARSTAEVSRFAVSKSFRNRIAEECRNNALVCDLSAAQVERRLMPCITLGLLRGILQYSIDYGFTHLCAVMEPALLRLMSRATITFRPIGGLIDHYGQRQPCYVDLAEQICLSRQSRPQHHDFIASEPNRTVPGITAHRTIRSTAAMELC